MARLPAVRDWQGAEARDWHDPEAIQQAFRMQPLWVQPEWKGFMRTVVLAVMPNAIWLWWLLTSRSERLCQAFSAHLCFFWAGLACLSLLATSFGNPGVVPRAASERPASATGSQLPTYRMIVVNGVWLRQHWCSTCELYRPPRSKHCSRCDRCVFRYDHFCPWLGNCVGLGNYRCFLALLWASTLFFGHAGTITVQVLYYHVRLHVSAQPCTSLLSGFCSLSAHRWELIYVVYALIAFSELVVLLKYHVRIIGLNLTTNEDMRGYYLYNPFDRRCINNWSQVFCAPYGVAVQVQV